MFRAVQTMRGWRLAGKSGMTATLAKVSANNHVLAFVHWAICFAGFLKERIRFDFFRGKTYSPCLIFMVF